MSRRRESVSAAPVFLTAMVAYGANCLLGASVAMKLIDTRNFRWVHHALYIVTCVTAGSAIVAGLSQGPRSSDRRAAVVLLPAAAPLAAIPYLGTHGRRHPLVALTAAPFFVAGLLLSRSAADRK